MNVTCPQCATVFRVDPAKVPERGVRARCSVCSGLIAVRRPTVAAPAVPPEYERPAVAAPATSRSPEAAAEPSVIPAPTPEPVAPVVQPPSPPTWTPVPEPLVEPPATVPPPREPIPTPETRPPIPPPPPPPAAPARDTHDRATGRFTNPFLQQDPAARARRLARALISDLVVYHPEKRQRGLADGNLKELFGEEIRKSWEEYAEQVGEDVANTTPYFTDALNEILAEGRKVFG